MPLNVDLFDKWLLDTTRDKYRLLVVESAYYDPAVGFPGSSLDIPKLFFATKDWIGRDNALVWQPADGAIVSPPVIERVYGQQIVLGEMDVVSYLPLSDRTVYDFIGRDLRVRMGDMSERWGEMLILEHMHTSSVRRIEENLYRFEFRVPYYINDFHLGREIYSHPNAPGYTATESIEDAIINVNAYDVTSSKDDPVFTNLPAGLVDTEVTVNIPAGEHDYTYRAFYQDLANGMPGVYFRRPPDNAVGGSIEMYIPDESNPDRVIYADDIIYNAITEARVDHRKDRVRIYQQGSTTLFIQRTMAYGSYLLSLGDDARYLDLKGDEHILAPATGLGAAVDALETLWQQDHITRVIELSPYFRPVQPGDVVQVFSRTIYFWGIVLRTRYVPLSDNSRIEVLSLGQ